MDFYKRMQHVCSQIPYGKVATYGQIAMLCGKPRNARQVGYGLRCNLAGEQVPAHRILNSSGILSGAAAFEYPTMQKILLESEGVFVKNTDRGWQVSIEEFGWKNTLAQAEEFLAFFIENDI